MSTELAFSRVRDPGGFMSNMSPHPILCGGVCAWSSEALFQALRFGLDTEAGRLVLAEKNPMQAKFVFKKLLGEGATLVVRPRSEQDLANMALCVRLKTEQHASLREALLETGEAILIEDTTGRWLRGRGDDFWGAHRHKAGWVGENHLGHIWMAQRASEQARTADAGELSW